MGNNKKHDSTSESDSEDSYTTKTKEQKAHHANYMKERRKEYNLDLMYRMRCADVSITQRQKNKQLLPFRSEEWIEHQRQVNVENVRKHRERRRKLLKLVNNIYQLKILQSPFNKYYLKYTEMQWCLLFCVYPL